MSKKAVSALEVIKNFIVSLWLSVCEFSEDKAPEILKAAKKIVFWFAVIAGITVIVFTIGLINHWQRVMFFSAIPLIVTILIAYTAPILLVKILHGTVDGIAGLTKNATAKEISEKTKEFTAAVKKLVAPLIIAAGVISFINAYTQITGFECLTWANVFILSSVVIALSILIKVFPKNKLFELLPAVIMIFSLLFSLTIWWAQTNTSPIAIALNSKIQQISLNIQSGSAKSYGIVKEDCVTVYKLNEKGDDVEKDGGTSVKKGDIVQVSDKGAKRFDGDLFLKVKLFNTETKNFHGGKTCLIPIEKLEICKTSHSTSKEGKKSEENNKINSAYTPPLGYEKGITSFDMKPGETKTVQFRPGIKTELAVDTKRDRCGNDSLLIIGGEDTIRTWLPEQHFNTTHDQVVLMALAPMHDIKLTLW
jgi:hypothetical protein